MTGNRRTTTTRLQALSASASAMAILLAAGGMIAVTATPADAQAVPGDPACRVVGNTVTCSGTLPDGVAVDGGGFDGLIVDNVTGDMIATERAVILYRTGQPNTVVTLDDADSTVRMSISEAPGVGNDRLTGAVTVVASGPNTSLSLQSNIDVMVTEIDAGETAGSVHQPFGLLIEGSGGTYSLINGGDITLTGADIGAAMRSAARDGDLVRIVNTGTIRSVDQPGDVPASLFRGPNGISARGDNRRVEIDNRGDILLGGGLFQNAISLELPSNGGFTTTPGVTPPPPTTRIESYLVSNSATIDGDRGIFVNFNADAPPALGNPTSEIVNTGTLRTRRAISVVDDGPLSIINSGTLELQLDPQAPLVGMVRGISVISGFFPSLTPPPLRIENSATGIIRSSADGVWGIEATNRPVTIVNAGLIELANAQGARGITVLGDAGIVAGSYVGLNQIENSGTINVSGADAYGFFGQFELVRPSDPALPDTRLSNTGIMSASGDGSTGIFVSHDNALGRVSLDLGANSVVSGGSGNGAGIRLVGGERHRIVNAGLITADSGNAIVGGSAPESVLNTGRIEGSIALGDGGDLFDNSGEATGDVVTGGGADRLINRETGVIGGNVVLSGTGDVATLLAGSTIAGTMFTNGGRLGGVGTIGGLDAGAGGTIAPGLSIGTLTVAGNASFGAGSTYEVEIAADGTSDLLAVGGTASLGGNLSVLGIAYPTGYPDAQDYTILTAGGGVSGSFDDVTDNLPDVDVVATYNANDVVIGYERAGEPPVDPEPETISPKEIHPNGLQAGLGAGRLFSETLQQRGQLHGLGGPNVGSAVPLGYGPTEGSHSADFVSDARYFGVAAWASVIGLSRDVDASGGIQGYDAGTYGLASGIDSTFDIGGALGRAGIALGHTNTDADVGASSASIDAWHVGIYGGVENGPFAVSGALSYAWQQYDFSRFVPFIGGGGVTAAGDTNGDLFAASLEASYDIASRMGIRQDIGLRLAPTISLDHVRGSRSGFTETGAGILNLAVAGDDISRTYLGAGVSMSARIVASNGIVFTPELQLMYERNVGDRRAVTTSSIAAAAATFTTPGVLEDDDFVSVGAGLGIGLTERATLDLRYDGSFGSNTKSHRGQVGLTVKF
jgi:outer membrane autotransporter protein